LLAIAFGGLILVDKIFGGGATFQVNDCLKKDGSGSDVAVIADCGDSSAYRVTGMVSSASECPDPNMPTVQQSKSEILCLTKAVAAPAATPSTTPAATATAKPSVTPSTKPSS
jgi:hypothetical protein